MQFKETFTTKNCDQNNTLQLVIQPLGSGRQKRKVVFEKIDEALASLLVIPVVDT